MQNRPHRPDIIVGIVRIGAGLLKLIFEKEIQGLKRTILWAAWAVNIYIKTTGK